VIFLLDKAHFWAYTIENSSFWGLSGGFKVGKKKNLFITVFIFSIVISGCQKDNPFVFIETKSGQSVFLDASRGKLIYVDESNRIIDYVDLRPDQTAISEIVKNKDQAINNKDRGSEDVPGTNYSVSLSTRFYNNRLLYVLRITPSDDKIKQFARTVAIDLTDRNGFNLGEIESTYSWTTIVDNDGKEMGLSTQGSIPITLRNYLEIYNWGPRWSSNY
jgi:hypothetical protein